MSVSKTILIIDDDHDTRVVLRDTLEREGHVVVSATNGVDGLSLLKSTNVYPELIILDIVMPFMSGDEFLSRLKNDPELATIPVIQVSGVETTQRPGTRCVLRKPLKLKELIELIQKF